MSTQHDVATVLGVVVLLLILRCIWCDKNPPGLTCDKPVEPPYPPNTPPDNHPVDTPVKKPNICLPVPNGPPQFPVCYPFTSVDRHHFERIGAGTYWLYPRTSEMSHSDPVTWKLDGWYVSNKGDDIHCDKTVNDPTYHGRFKNAAQGGCGGIE
jgi:hypothetical protein